jgi:hypothetical protein
MARYEVITLYAHLSKVGLGKKRMLNQDVTGQLSLLPTLHTYCMYCEVYGAGAYLPKVASGCNLFQSEGPPGARHMPASATVAE